MFWALIDFLNLPLNISLLKSANNSKLEVNPSLEWKCCVQLILFHPNTYRKILIWISISRKYLLISKFSSQILTLKGYFESVPYLFIAFSIVQKRIMGIHTHFPHNPSINVEKIISLWCYFRLIDIIQDVFLPINFLTNIFLYSTTRFDYIIRFNDFLSCW